MTTINLIHGECLEEMDKLIKQGIKIDAIITDPPYGTTACKWDSVIDFDAMWQRLNNLIKPNGAVVLFGSEPFSSALRMSNIKNYKYDWKWEKNKPNGFVNAKNKPLKTLEDVCVFSDGVTANTKNIHKKTPYNPQGVKRVCKTIKSGIRKRDSTVGERPCRVGGSSYIQEFTGYPVEKIAFSNTFKDRLHPTQKPVALMEYLIKTYTNEGETVLDFTMGSGTTGVACKNTNRKFIGIEMDDNYFKIAQERINNNEPKNAKEQVVPTGEMFTSEWGLV